MGTEAGAWTDRLLPNTAHTMGGDPEENHSPGARKPLLWTLLAAILTASSFRGAGLGWLQENQFLAFSLHFLAEVKSGGGSSGPTVRTQSEETWRPSQLAPELPQLAVAFLSLCSSESEASSVPSGVCCRLFMPLGDAPSILGYPS